MKFFTGLISSLAILTVLNFGLTSNVFAEKSTEIYKWVDKDGRVHYAARPGDKSAKKMHLGSKIFHEKNKKDEDLEKQDQQAAERDKLCSQSKKTVAKYKKAPFLYRYDEERQQKIRLTKKEAKDAFVQAEKDVSYWCNPLPTATTKEAPDKEE